MVMYMNIINKIKNIIIGNWRNITGYEDEESKKRLEICNSCDKVITVHGSKICGMCGCFIKAKTKDDAELKAYNMFKEYIENLPPLDNN